MNNGSFVSERDLGADRRSDQLQFEKANTTSPTGLPTVNGHLACENGVNGSGELRASVSRHFMSMLREHDRARLKLLSANSAQGKANC